MLFAVLRLLTIFALATMPLVMARASAPAQPAATHAMSGEHCPQPGDKKSGPARTMDCAAACTALPASPAKPLATLDWRPAVPTGAGITRISADYVPEIATPPPRLVRG